MTEHLLLPICSPFRGSGRQEATDSCCEVGRQSKIIRGEWVTLVAKSGIGTKSVLVS